MLSCSLQVTWTYPGKSITTDFGLVCGRSWLVELANTLFFVGFFLGNGVCGRLADAYGRRTVLAYSALAAALSSAGAAAAWHYWIYVFARMLTACTSAGIYLGGYVLIRLCMSCFGHASGVRC